MQENSFQDHLKAVKNAAQTAAEKSMSKATDDVKAFYEPEDDVYNIRISGDGTWRRRGFSSCHGVVTAMSTVTGKAIDCEIMSKKSAGSVCLGEARKLLQNSRTGRRDISMNVRLISRAHQEQWMLLVCMQFFKDPLKGTVLVMWSFYAMETARPTKAG